MAIALILVLVAVGSVLFHFLSPWWWTPIASNWRYIDATIIITFWITGVVFIAVVLFMAYCVFRFRHREGRRAAYEPESKKLEVVARHCDCDRCRGHVGARLVRLDSVRHSPAGATEVEVIGQQWQWSYRLPGKRRPARYVRHPQRQCRQSAGLKSQRSERARRHRDRERDLHLPIGKPVKVLLRSIDVVHDFYVPEFRAKMDLMPGLVTYFWFTPTRTGTFEILCAGILRHRASRRCASKVVVEEESDYQAWLQKQQTFAQLSGMREHHEGGYETRASANR